MQQDPYSVSADASLASVATKMAERKYGSAVVVQGERVIGVFTTIDALKALASLIKPRPTARARTTARA
jgi:acetoin utilization protein AcuB